MGQTLSYNSSTGELHLTADIAGDTIAQVLLFNSGLDVADVTPAPGWRCRSVNGTTVALDHRPGTQTTGLSALTVQTDQLAATLSTAPDSGTTVALTPYTAAPQDNTSTITTGVWVSRPLEFSTTPFGEVRVVIPPAATVATTAKRWADIHVYEAQGDEYTLTVTSGNAALSEDGTTLLPASNPPAAGVYTVTVEAEDAGLNTATATIVVTVQAVSEADTEATSISLDNPDAVLTLSHSLFDPTEVSTHVWLGPTGNVVLTLNAETTTAADEAGLLCTASEADAVTVSVARSLGVRTARATESDGIDFLLSFDGGLTFVIGGTFAVAPIPCIGGEAYVVARHSKGAVRRALSAVQPGQMIMDHRGHWRRVTKLHESRPQLTRIVYIPAHAFALNRPHTDTWITPNHRIMLPNNQVMAAIGAVHNSRRCVLLQKIMVLRHVELDQGYGFFYVNNLRVESWAHSRKAMQKRTPHGLTAHIHRRRRQLANAPAPRVHVGRMHRRVVRVAARGLRRRR